MIRQLMLFLCLFLFACQSALTPDGYAHDPYEPFNRFSYRVNERLDQYLLKPIALTYDKAIPDFIQNRLHSFLSNLQDANSLVNSLLQTQWEQSVHLYSRLINNTFFGLGGLFDVATELGNEKIEADFGQTLAHYGVQSGPYLMLPFFGPTTPRDALGSLVDSALNPRAFLKPTPRIALALSDKIDFRSQLLGKEPLLQDSPDPYSTLRDAWLQWRWSKIGQGSDFDALFEEAQ